MPESHTKEAEKEPQDEGVKVFKRGMFGLFRYYLAVMVCISHLMPWEFMHFGIYAVLAFFTLSGYLITLSYKQHYSKQEAGLARFYVNRFMRVYPAYFLILMISIVFVLFWPEEAFKANERFTWPANSFDWFSNFFVASLTYPNGVRTTSTIVPPAWSLGIELTIWFFIPFFLKYKKLGAAWVIFSFMAFFYLTLPEHSFLMRYYSIVGNSICFVIGFLMCLYYTNIRHFEVPKWAGYAVLVLYPLVYPVSFVFWDTIDAQLNSGMYLFIPINTIAIIVLSNIKRDPSKVLINKLDEFLGDVSYPLFLCHILCGGFILLLFPEGFEQRTMPYFIVSFILSNIVAALMVLVVEENVKKIRAKIRA